MYYRIGHLIISGKYTKTDDFSLACDAATHD